MNHIVVGIHLSSSSLDLLSVSQFPIHRRVKGFLRFSCYFSVGCAFLFSPVIQARKLRLLSGVPSWPQAGRRKKCGLRGAYDDDDFLKVVKNAPLVSIDLVLRSPDIRCLWGW